LSSRKKKRICKFCQEKANYIKLYNDYFCPKCLRFQNESHVREVKPLPIMKLRKYNFTTHKYSYIINNELGSRIGSCERRDLSKFISKKDFDIRYIFLNDVNRIVASVDSKSMNNMKNVDAFWKIYDYGRNLRGEIKHLHEDNTWQILNSNNEIIAIRNPLDSGADSQTARAFSLVDPENTEREFFKITRKGGGFLLEIIDNEFDPHFAWTIVIAIHRRYYL
jgi:hypothetical protein